MIEKLTVVAVFPTLVRRDEMNRHGRLFVTIGRKTISAAQGTNESWAAALEAYGRLANGSE